ncbi:hypothetical protein Sme01_21840 [Sphaerisporangium melleum]|uniref:PIN domain-containing protein n=1 Tax=Sphaerisporangium melleum TaxID=321316 RepID=A0A917QZF9_9ACTN|nr:hypothetical protein [Sphaerisporangium melleum]GGK79387.1 hypothetical protein GCM10007964_22540 [Sphaerisporangium melleum]GII69708.1 hypothetical protein Sme01_21840 [Sphaerisporangium melleum]
MTMVKLSDPLPSLVADAMVIHHFAKADRLDVLGACVVQMTTTNIVADEIERYVHHYPSLVSLAKLEWLQILPQDTDEELIALHRWAALLGAGAYDLGEASVFAAAETHSMIALTDDRDATRVGRRRGLEIHGTVWLLTRLYALQKMTLVEICGHVDALRSTGMRLPCTGTELPRWAQHHGLL